VRPCGPRRPAFSGIQQWLNTPGGKPVTLASLTLPAATDLPDTTPDDPQQTPETYLGSERQQYFDGGTGTLTVSSAGTTKVIRVTGAPDIYPVATEQPAQDGTVTIRLSPGLQAYSFTFG